MKTIRYTEEQVIEAVGPLTRTRLHRFVEAECLMPARDGGEVVFTDADVARIELLCELRDDLDIGDEALPVVMNLLDQVHGLRRELRRMALAIERQPAEVRAEVLRTRQELEEG